MYNMNDKVQSNQDTQHSKESVDSYIANFKKDLNFLQKIVVSTVEPEMKSVLKGEKPLPKKLSDLIWSWIFWWLKKLVLSFSSDTEKCIIEFLKTTKDKLNCLKQDVLANPSGDNQSWTNNPWSPKTNSLEQQEIIPSLTPEENFIYSWARKIGMKDKRQIAYVLATVKGECNFKNIKEIWWEKRKYWQPDPETRQCYYGRWYIQLTLKGNYQAYTKIIQNSHLTFKDNQGNVLKNIDLVNNPDIILQSNDLAAFILVHWMHCWNPCGKKLSNYIHDDQCDYKNARRLINGDVVKNGDKFAGYARRYEEQLNLSMDAYTKLPL